LHWTNKNSTHQNKPTNAKLSFMQAKNHHYSVAQLLANNEKASEFSEGFFATIYLFLITPFGILIFSSPVTCIRYNIMG
jgi:phosphatidylserine decarboxylase